MLGFHLLGCGPVVCECTCIYIWACMCMCACVCLSVWIHVCFGLLRCGNVSLSEQTHQWGQVCCDRQVWHLTLVFIPETPSISVSHIHTPTHTPTQRHLHTHTHIDIRLLYKSLRIVFYYWITRIITALCTSFTYLQSRFVISINRNVHILSFIHLLKDCIITAQRCIWTTTIYTQSVEMWNHFII